MILIGEYGVGKSSLFRRFTTNTFVTATDRTVTLGLDNYGKVFEVSSYLKITGVKTSTYPLKHKRNPYITPVI